MASRSTWVLAVTIVAASAPRAAYAGETIAVIDIDVTAGVEPWAGAAAENGTAEGLEAAGYDVRWGPAVRGAIVAAGLGECRAGECLHEVADLAGTPILLFGVLTRAPRGVVLRLWLLDGRSGREIAWAKTRCTDCSEPLLTSLASDAVRELHLSRGAGDLDAGAPAEPPGGGTTTGSPAIHDSLSPQQGGGALIGPVLVGAGGLGLVAWGIALLTLHGRGACTTDAPETIDYFPGLPPREADRCANVYATLRFGIPLVAGGGAGLLAGVTWALLSRRGSSKGVRAAGVVPVPGGAAVTVSGAW